MSDYASRLSATDIERRSREIALNTALRYFSPPFAHIAAAMVYATGDRGLCKLIKYGGDPVFHAQRCLTENKPLLVDVHMVACGIRKLSSGLEVHVALEESSGIRLTEGHSRVAAGMEQLLKVCGDGSIVAIGSSPSALITVLELRKQGIMPAVVIATCPGFTLAKAAKAELVKSGIPYITVAGTRGGSPLAVAAVNALISLAGNYTE